MTLEPTGFHPQNCKHTCLDHVLLTIECYPVSLEFNLKAFSLNMLPEGFFKWGRYRTAPGIQSPEEGWSLLNALWQQDRKVRINIRGAIRI